MSVYNSPDYFTTSLIENSGFREYDVRWIVEPINSPDDVSLNYRGLISLGQALGKFLQLPQNGNHHSVLLGHDFRKYSENVKNALTIGIMGSGMEVVDAGLVTTPAAYFAQYFYQIPACAMVTASHNPNGWTGVKIGYDYSRTLGPPQIKALNELLEEQLRNPGENDELQAGRYTQKLETLDEYIRDLTTTWRNILVETKGIKVAVETGNGTGGLVLPPLLEELGFDVIHGNTILDWTYPQFNPNPESIPFLRAVQNLVCTTGADIGICVDGDCDRVGIIDDRGRIIFSDRIALLVAKHIEDKIGAGLFIVDVKSTSLFNTLLESEIGWEKTGHSYIKEAVAREDATAGFERSGHFFFTEPYGRGYDDACVSSMMVLWLLCKAKRSGKRFSDLVDRLPKSFQSPTRQVEVPESRKYKIVDEIRQRIEEFIRPNGVFAGVEVSELLTINGIRVNLADGSWLLVRASSNVPHLVIIGESFDEDGSRLIEMDTILRQLCSDVEDMGEFDSLAALE
jgi:phosphomannomutase/phosphoglucomutase